MTDPRFPQPSKEEQEAAALENAYKSFLFQLQDANYNYSGSEALYEKMLKPYRNGDRFSSDTTFDKVAYDYIKAVLGKDVK